jgi:predicted Zn-dependent protease
VQSSFTILFGILLLSIVISSSLALVHTADASTDDELFEDLEESEEKEEEEEEDFEEQDFEEENSIQICCAWGSSLEDGILTYYIDDDDTSEEQKQAVRNAVQEWDTKIEPLELEEESSKKTSDITIEFKDDNDKDEIAGQTITVANAYGFLVNAQITIYEGIQEYEFDTTTIGQVAKHEIGHALGLGHANFDGNLMAEMVNYGTATVSECEINAVIEANYWKLGDNGDDNIQLDTPRDDSITC